MFFVCQPFTARHDWFSTGRPANKGIINNNSFTLEFPESHVTLACNMESSPHWRFPRFPVARRGRCHSGISSGQSTFANGSQVSQRTKICRHNLNSRLRYNYFWFAETTSAILEFYFRLLFPSYHRNRMLHQAAKCHCGNMTSYQFSRWYRHPCCIFALR